MKFESSIELSNWVKRIEKSSIFEVIFFLFLSIVASLSFYDANNNFLLNLFLILAVSVPLFATIYSVAVKQKSVVISTISRIKIDEEKITLETYAYKIFNLKKVPNKNLSFTRNEYQIKKSSYPISDKKLGNNVYKLKIGKDELFFFPDFFDSKVLDFLLSKRV